MPTTGTMRYLKIGDATYEVYDTNEDTKVYQSYKAASGYTYWRPLIIGYSSGSAETFTPADQTNLTYTFDTLKVQPSSGTIRFGAAALANGNYTNTISADTLTADRTLTAPNKSGTIALTSDISDAISILPSPMIFKGSVGTGGTVTWTNLPLASSDNEGFTYKVITYRPADPTDPVHYPEAKVGDTIISNGSEWIVIPSGDEPSGTVTSVGLSNATNGGLTISGSPITSSGSITVGHSNVLTSAQTTQAIYPIKIDKNGHISSYGTAVTIPDVSGKFDTAGIGLDSSGTTVKTKLNSETAITDTSKVYNVGVNSSGELCVKVPWQNDMVNMINGYSSTIYLAGGYSSSTMTHYLYKNSSLYVTIPDNTNTIYLTLGDSATSGKEGYIRLYGSSTSYTDLKVSASTSAKTITFPDKTGTVALTSDIPTVPTITLNGSSTTSPSFYAPTSAGTAGQIIRWDGAAGPEWDDLPDVVVHLTITEDPDTTLPIYTADMTHAEIVAEVATEHSVVLVAHNEYEDEEAENGIYVDGYRYVYYLTECNIDDDSSMPLCFTRTRCDGYNSIQLDSFWIGSSNNIWYETASLSADFLTTKPYTADMTYYLLGVYDQNQADGFVYKNPSLKTHVTADSVTSGHTRFELGNSTATSSAGGKEGIIRFYGTAATYYTDLKSSATSSNKTITLPDKTGTIALTSDLTDKKLELAETTDGTTYYPVVGTGTTAATRQYDTNGFKYYMQEGTTNNSGYSTLSLGNSIAKQTAGNRIGRIHLYSGTTLYGAIISNDLTDVQTWTLPDKTGTVALTSDIPSRPVITLNGIQTNTPSFYAPTSAGTDGYFLKSNGSGAPTWATIPAGVTVTLNGSTTTTPSFYAPTGAGTSGQYLKSSGSGAPTWTNFPTIPTITLNGSSTTSPSFYAPTSAGTSGYVLTSNGSGAPSWSNATATPTASTISKFDSSAKMNSTDMSSSDIATFVAGLNTGVSDYIQRSELGDYIVDEGSSGIWTYRKWNSGIAECWGYTTGTGTFSSWGNIYSHDRAGEDYPFEFVDYPYVSGTITALNGNMVSSITESNGRSKTTSPPLIAVRGSSWSGTQTFNYYWYAKGKWK